MPGFICSIWFIPNCIITIFTPAVTLEKWFQAFVGFIVYDILCTNVLYS